jgi:hypothetical protein
VKGAKAITASNVDKGGQKANSIVTSVHAKRVGTIKGRIIRHSVKNVGMTQEDVQLKNVMNQGWVGETTVKSIGKLT